MKRPAFEPRILALAHEPLHVLLGNLQIAERHSLKLAAPIRTWGHFPQPFEGQGQIAFEDLLAKRVRPTKIAVCQLLNVSHAEAFVTHSHDELDAQKGVTSIQTTEEILFCQRLNDWKYSPR